MQIFTIVKINLVIMQDLAPEFQAALSSEYSQLAYVLRLELRTGAIYRFSSYDIPIQIAEEIYTPQASISPLAAESANNPDSSSAGISGIIDSGILGEELLLSGALNGAIARLFLVNPFALPMSFEETPQKFIEFPATYVKGIRQSDTRWELETSNFSYRLKRKIGIETSKYCRAIFGDSLCQFNLALVTTNNLEVQPGSTRKLLIHDSSFPQAEFQYGKVIFSTGNNAGIGRSIFSDSGAQIRLRESLPFVPQVGDRFSAIRGCAHTKLACLEYENVENFRAESAIPGTQGFAGGI